MPERFQLVCEVEPPPRPDLERVRQQIGVLSPVAAAFLATDNHMGRATVSSVAVAQEVRSMGGHAIACLNARDRNVLGFRRDLLTGAAYGVNEFLLVHGDTPTSGARAGDLTVRSMLDELRALSAAADLRAGVATATGRRLPAWKREADFLFVQVAFSVEELVEWRASVEFSGAVYPGVIVLPSAAMARKLTASIPELTVPSRWVEAVERDPTAGVELACDLVDAIKESGVFEGAHLVPVGRHRQVAARLGTT